MRKLLGWATGLVLLLALGLAAAVTGHEYRLQAWRDTPARPAAATRPPAGTEVVVLGTVHFPTAACTADSLYRALETLQPDVILFEIDSTRLGQIFQRPPLGLRLALALGVEAESNEVQAVARYRRWHPAALVQPYEWGRRDAFHRRYRILTTPDLVFSQLAELRAAGQLTVPQRRILAQYDSLTARLNALGRGQTLAVLNSVAIDSLAQRRQNYQYHKIKTIVDGNDRLREFRGFYRVNERYWDVRNRAMAANIQRYATLYPGRRLVVLAGFFHRYYLRRELAAGQAAGHYRLADLPKPPTQVP